MTGVLPAEKYLEAVQLSGLVKPDRLKSLLAALQKASSTIPDTQQISLYFEEQGALTPWQNKKLLCGKYKGFFLDKYKMLNHLGTGGMSTVYLAEHTLMQRRVAIKVLPHAKVGDSSYLERFFREARAIASLDHPNIVQAYSADNEKNTYYIVMEFVEGQDLEKTVLENGPLPYADAVNYIRQAADGLAHAHEKDMIHRDIKPSNLLLDKEGTLKILDMGLARLTGTNERALTMEHSEKVLGTTDFLPPEQAVNSSSIDHRADIYALGGTMYFLLTGHVPFPEGTMAQRLLMHQVREPASILIDRPDCPEELIQICSKMMAKKPEDRYQSGGEVRDALTAWQESQGIHIPLRPKASMSATMVQKAADSSTVEIPRVNPVPKARISSKPTTSPVATTAPVAEPALEGFFSQIQESASNSSVFENLLATGSSVNRKSGGASSVVKKRKNTQQALIWGSASGVAALLLVGMLVMGSSESSSTGIQGKNSADSRLNGLSSITSAQLNQSLKSQGVSDEYFALSSPFPIGRRHDASFTVRQPGEYRLAVKILQCPSNVLGRVLLDKEEIQASLPLNSFSGQPKDFPLAVRSLTSGEHTLSIELRPAATQLPTWLHYEDWYLMGPFDNSGTKGYDAQYPPEKTPFNAQQTFEGKGKKQLKWVQKKYANDATHDLQAEMGDNSTYYLYRKFNSDQNCKLSFYTGSDDQCKFWLNGKLVHQFKEGRGVVAYNDQFPVDIRQGSNEILFKVCQGGGGTGFFFSDHPNPGGDNLSGPPLEYGVLFPPAK